MRRDRSTGKCPHLNMRWTERGPTLLPRVVHWDAFCPDCCTDFWEHRNLNDPMDRQRHPTERDCGCAYSTALRHNQH